MREAEEEDASSSAGAKHAMSQGDRSSSTAETGPLAQPVMCTSAIEGDMDELGVERTASAGPPSAKGGHHDGDHHDD